MLCINYSSFSQSVQFPTEDAVWSVYSESIGLTERDTTIHYISFGDTLIENEVYQKLYASNDTLPSIANRLEYVGSYKELNRRFLFIASDSITQDTVYDFNLEVGTVIDSYENCLPKTPDCLYFAIQSVDTIMTLDGVKRKRYNIHKYVRIDEDRLEGFYIFSWIEGIGSTIGLIPNYNLIYFQSFPISPVTIETLLCFKEKEALTYTDSLLYDGNCFIDKFVSVQNQYLKDVEIYPNPFYSNVEVLLDKDRVYRLSLDVFNSLGQRVHQQEVENSNASISLSYLPSGTYYLKITDTTNREAFITRQIIKL
jgi:hypothetical protein